jgi:hypothetical protein
VVEEEQKPLFDCCLLFKKVESSSSFGSWEFGSVDALVTVGSRHALCT